MNYFLKRSNFIALIAMIAITAIFVLSGFDAWWLTHLQGTMLAKIFSLAGMLGFFVPVILWASLLLVGFVVKNKGIMIAAWTAATAGIAGVVITAILKAFTGRIGPPHSIPSNILQLSQTFHFGFLRDGIFWGWPSSHTTVAFAMSVALAVFYWDKKWVKYLAIAYAVYIGIGASMSFHWASDVVAGVILGTMIGVVAGRVFSTSTS